MLCNRLTRLRRKPLQPPLSVDTEALTRILEQKKGLCLPHYLLHRLPARQAAAEPPPTLAAQMAATPGG